MFPYCHYYCSPMMSKKNICLARIGDIAQSTILLLSVTYRNDVQYIRMQAILKAMFQKNFFFAHHGRTI